MQRGSSRHRPGFHALVLAIGFIVGGFMQAAARKFLPLGAVKQFFDLGVHPSFGIYEVDLIILKFSFGVVLDVTLLSLLGVLVAYLIARSLF